MARNVEIKAKVRDFTNMSQAALKVTALEPTEIQQEDVFFHTPDGYLKLRILAENQGELIFYVREDYTGPKTSKYSVSKTSEPLLLKTVLASAYGIRAIVRKTRFLYMSGRTRIHVDRVEGLGDFMELEVVLEEGEDAAVGHAEAEDLIRKLNIQPENLVSRAYVDLLEAKHRSK